MMAMSHQWQPLPRLKALAVDARAAMKKILKSMMFNLVFEGGAYD
jgi:hypothetical protein